MKNPWLNIPAADYEAHMALPEVAQAQALNKQLASALTQYNPRSLAVIGCTTGNGLEHIDTTYTRRVVGVDINPDYLVILKSRFADKMSGLELLAADITAPEFKIVPVAMMFAGLVFEYLDVTRALNNIARCLASGGILLSVLQLPSPDSAPVTTTRYKSLQRLVPIMNLVPPEVFSEICGSVGLQQIKTKTIPLKKGKAFFVGHYQKFAKALSNMFIVTSKNRITRQIRLDAKETSMFDKLEKINSRPTPFQFYTAEDLWTDEHTSKKMLEYHLDVAVDLSSRNKDFINRSVKWIVSHFGINSNTSIADFGCGPGLYTTGFAENNAEVTGIDFSGRSIQYAKKIADQKELNITYCQQNYLEFETEKRFDIITMIFCDYCALSPSQRKTMLAKFYTFLKPNGKVLLDVHSLNTFNNREEVATYERNQLDNFWSPENYYGFLNTFKYEKEKVTLDKYTIIEEDKIRVVYNWLQYFSRDSLREEFEENGFEAEGFYSDVAGSNFSPESPDMAIVARKTENT